MRPWKYRLIGLTLMVLGGFLFVWAIKYVSSEWPQIFTGLLSIFFLSMGFGLLIMPIEARRTESTTKTD
ncbi:MAG: hypothetical protein ACE5G9_08325 [Nitrospinales bacterium]